MHEKKYSPIEFKQLLSNIVISERGREKIGFSTKSGVSVAYGYAGLHTSTLGVHVEFTLKHIYLPSIYFSTQGNPRFFIWHPDNHPDIYILQPRGIIEGTSFVPSNFYVDPKDLYIDGMPLMKREKKRV